MLIIGQATGWVCDLPQDILFPEEEISLLNEEIFPEIMLCDGDSTELILSKNHTFLKIGRS